MGMLKKLMPAVAKAAKAVSTGAVGKVASQAKGKPMVGSVMMAVGKAKPDMGTMGSRAKASGPIGKMLGMSNTRGKMFNKGGAAMKSSDASGRALGRKTADAKGRAMKKGK